MRFAPHLEVELFDVAGSNLDHELLVRHDRIVFSKHKELTAYGLAGSELLTQQVQHAKGRASLLEST